MKKTLLALLAVSVFIPAILVAEETTTTTTTNTTTTATAKPTAAPVVEAKKTAVLTVEEKAANETCTKQGLTGKNFDDCVKTEVEKTHATK